MTLDAAAGASSRAPTGIAGLDVVTRGGIPRGRMTCLVGGAGTGKTVLAMQSLVWAARHGESADADLSGLIAMLALEPAR